LQNATFAMVTGGDSVVFGPANGSVSLKDGIFVGKNGKFNWQAAGDSTIYADLDVIPSISILSQTGRRECHFA
jgi:hypothetical protein